MASAPLIEKGANVARVGEYYGVIERKGEDAFVSDLLENAIDAAGTVSGDGHGEAGLTGHFGVRSVIEEHGYDFGIA